MNNLISSKDFHLKHKGTKEQLQQAIINNPILKQTIKSKLTNENNTNNFHETSLIEIDKKYYHIEDIYLYNLI